ncbi:MAG TPA: valine--tRNA ligase [Patescibacteria group bacterium]|nr:valine--tRNA ligase [Patescibacteria group bacterium]
MDKQYDPKKVEDRIYKLWEEKGYFKPEVNPKGTPYCIILPPPNANGALHFGHVMFTAEDILIRFKRMQGFSALWLPGTDHAGIETQFVFEKKLKEEGKSRLDFDQDTLYKMIWEYVEKNRGGIENQLRRLGFSLDWSREKYTLDPNIIKLVYKTFKWMFDDGLVYRDFRLVNYCTFDGTSFSDLEVVHKEKESALYFIKYFFEKGGGHISVATTRPETIIADVAVAVNPMDERYKGLEGKNVINPQTKQSIPIIYDELVDLEFGSGALKITPGHDPKDFEIAKKHELKGDSLIGFDGKIKDGKYKGLYVKQAREKIIEDFSGEGLIEKTDKIIHQVPVCYKCQNPIEPLLMEQWFIKVKSLKEKAVDVVKKGKIKIYPKNFESQYFDWLENLNDWNISRQIVWGIRIPAFRNKKTNEWVVTEGKTPQGDDWEQDKDTFDTWFSSGQWPYVTLSTAEEGDLEKFYPTDVLETAYDILRAWVSRMVMLGIYIQEKLGVEDSEKQVPFRTVLFHGIVNDPYGKKMSKSKGNVVDPLELVEAYGADAVRFSLIYGNATGNDQSLSQAKLEAAKKFANKLWNIARFIEMSKADSSKKGEETEVDAEMKNKIETLVSEVTKDLNGYNFNFATDKIYDFIWHEFADKYVEDVKKRINSKSYAALLGLYNTLLRLLHPFMPFITEEIYQNLGGEGSIMISKWPK